MYNTDISFFWLWADKLVERMASEMAPWIAGSSTYCNNLAKIQNGTVDRFRVPLFFEYSQTLMVSSQENLQVISMAVNCDFDTEMASGKGMIYPLNFERQSQCYQYSTSVNTVGGVIAKLLQGQFCHIVEVKGVWPPSH
ncbi:hypothetical protein PC123_g15828 [Phytophthora cactorum]|nr:hypothetical protein PC123_g15828 [Phytophthora cactorum]